MRKAFQDVFKFMQTAGQRIGRLPMVKVGDVARRGLQGAFDDLHFRAANLKECAGVFSQRAEDGKTDAHTMLGASLMLEELAETLLAMSKGDEAGLADGLADLVYVTIFTAILHGIDLGPVWEEVQRSNMAKFPDGKAIKDASGKVQKPKGWTPPDVEAVLARQRPLRT